VTVQNGIGAERAVAARRPDQPVIAASLTASVELGPADVVVRLSRGGIALAPLAGAAAPVARSLAAAFERGGLRARVLGDPEAMKWSKLLANLVGNATSALLDVDPATIYRDPRLFEIERRQIREAMAVMAALGRRPVALPGADTRLLAFAFRLPSALGRPILARVVGGARGGKSPSLRLRLAEVGAADRSATVTEAAWLNGAVASEGIATRVATPVNAGLARLVDEAAGDPERRTFLRGRPDRLLRELDADGRTP
jgi:2-dehydropantoate 2-reductase